VRAGKGRAAERGSTIPLIIGFTTVLLLAAAVVIDATAAYLQRQSLSALADSVSMIAADEAAKGLEVYGAGLDPERLRLSAREAEDAVADHLRAIGVEREFHGLVAVTVVVGDQVNVTLTAPLDLPLAIPGGPEAPRVTGRGSAAVAVGD
jgi:hypothetical protein